jgi:hypothetical protein
VKYLIARGEIALFDTTSVAKVRSGGGGGSGSSEPQKGGSAPAPRVWSCEQLEAGLRARPIMKIEQAVQPWPRQYSAFFALASSVHHAADVIAESCPKDAALTPTGRLDEGERSSTRCASWPRPSVRSSPISMSCWTTGRNPASSR